MYLNLFPFIYFVVKFAVIADRRTSVFDMIFEEQICLLKSLWPYFIPRIIKFITGCLRQSKAKPSSDNLTYFHSQPLMNLTVQNQICLVLDCFALTKVTLRHWIKRMASWTPLSYRNQRTKHSLLTVGSINLVSHGLQWTWKKYISVDSQ